RGRCAPRASRADTSRRRAAARARSGLRCAAGSPSVVRRGEGIEPLLGAVDVLARAGQLVLVDLRLAAGADDVRDGVRAEQQQMAVLDLELIAIERTHGRAGGAVALRVVLAAVTRAAEADRKSTRLNSSHLVI